MDLARWGQSSTFSSGTAIATAAQKIEFIYQTRFYGRGFSNSWHAITSHQRDLLFEENSPYISPQFYFEKQIDWATYRSTSLTDICICFHLASNNLSQDRCNIIDCALKIELQSGAHNFRAIFCLTGHFNIKLEKQGDREYSQQFIVAVNRH